VLFESQLRGYLASDGNLHAVLFRRRKPLHDEQQGAREFPERDGCRYGISGNADDGPAVDRGQKRGFAGMTVMPCTSSSPRSSRSAG